MILSRRDKIVKLSQWGFEGKLPSVQDAVESLSDYSEPQHHVRGTIVGIEGQSYRLGDKIGEEGDVDYYESWWSSPDLPNGQTLHYVEIHEPKKDKYWEIETITN